MKTIRPGIINTAQQGMVMLTTMILLIAVTLMIVTASNLVQTNLKVVQNMESREQARYAAIAAIEEAVSDGGFITTPGDIFTPASSCGGTQVNTKCYDTNGDGSTDVTVKFVDPEPRCVMKTPKKNSELRPYINPAEAACFSTGSPFSLCAESVWEFVAVATDEVTGAEVVVRQGVSIESTANQLSIFCPD